MTIHRDTGSLLVAIGNAGVEVKDARGLMPVNQARELVKGLKIFERGEGRDINDVWVWDSDLVWAALCSLEDAAEFLAVTRGLVWDMSPRGNEDNVDFYNRYGDGILPLIDDLICDDGTTRRRSEDGYTSCGWAKTCLLEIGGESTAAIALRLGAKGFMTWLERHPESLSWLEAQAAEGDPRALNVMKLLKRPEKIPAKVKAVLAEVEPLAITRFKALTPLRVNNLLADYELPLWGNMNVFYGGMSITGFVAPDHADTLIIQALQIGPGDSDLCLELYRVSPDRGVWVGGRQVLVHEDQSIELGQLVELPELGIKAIARVDTEGLEGKLLAQFKKPGDPREELLVRLGQQFPKQVYLDDESLRVAADLPASAVPLFRFNTFKMPRENVEESLDFLAMLLALRERCPIRRLPQGIHPLHELATKDD
jgi:hypothetical protein